MQCPRALIQSPAQRSRQAGVSCPYNRVLGVHVWLLCPWAAQRALYPLPACFSSAHHVWVLSSPIVGCPGQGCSQHLMTGCSYNLPALCSRESPAINWREPKQQEAPAGLGDAKHSAERRLFQSKTNLHCFSQQMGHTTRLHLLVNHKQGSSEVLGTAAGRAP